MAIASDSSDMFMETEVGVVYSMIPGKNMKLVSMYPPKCAKPDADGRRELVCRDETDCDSGKESEAGTICRCTYTGRPLGTAEFIGKLKQKTRRALEFWKAGANRGGAGRVVFAYEITWVTASE